MPDRNYFVRLRFARGYSMREVAEISGLSSTTICNLEQGRMIRPSSIPKIAQTYGITPQEFVVHLFEDGDKPKE